MKQTRKIIQESFIALANEKPVDKITVKEIVDRCQINRNSFYYHFQDLPDLIESIFEDQLNEEVSHHANEGIQAVLLATVESLEDKHDICRNIYYSKNRDILFMRISRIVTRIVEDCLKETYMPHYVISDEDFAIIVQLYRMEVSGFILDWLHAGMNYDLTRRIGRMLDLRAGTLENMFEKAQRTRLSAAGQDYHLRKK
ncbi:TetR/AcrR family transcriptional regulator C-terminal domain-containing protein [Erysipelotrichaceae bacterium 51-3]